MFSIFNQHSHRTGVNNRVDVALALLLFVAMAAFVYLPVLVPDNSMDYFGMVDTSLLLGPNLYFLDHSIHVDRDFPTWNPLILCGTPFAANPESLSFYPPNLLRSLLNVSPTPLRTMRSATIFVWLHLVLAGLGAFFLARAHRVSRSGGLIAAMAVAFSFGSLQTAQINPYFLLTAAWLPTLLLVLRKALTADRWISTAKFILLGGVTFSLLVLSGFSPYLPVVAASMLIYCGVHWATSATGHRLAAPRIDPRRAALQCALVFTGIALVGILLSAAMLLPGAEFGRATTRASDSPVNVQVRHPGVEEFPTPRFLLERIVFYAPLARGFRPCGAGAGIALLATFAFWHPRRRELIPYGALFYLLLDCTVGPPMPVALAIERFTPFQLSNPDYVALLTTVPLSVFAAFGMDALRRPDENPKTLRRRTAIGLAMSALIVIAVFDAMTLNSNVQEFDDLMDTRAETVMPWAAIAAAAVAACAIALSAWKPCRRFALAVAMLGIFMEMYLASRNLVPFPRDRVELFALPQSVADRVDDNRAEVFWNDNERNYGLYWNTLTYCLEATPTGYDPLHLVSTYRLLAGDAYRSGEDIRFIPSNVLAHSYPWLRRSFWLAENYVIAPLPPVTRPYPFVSTVFLTSDPPLPMPRINMDELPERYISSNTARTPLQITIAEPSFPAPFGEPMFIDKAVAIERPEPVQSVLSVRTRIANTKSFTATAKQPDGGHIEQLTFRKADVGADRVAELEINLPLPDWDRSVVALSLECDPESITDLLGADLIQDRADEGKLIRVLERTADRLRIQVECPGNRILLFTDAHYPGWRAWANGVEQPIIHANDAFKAITLPAGTHEVVFEFRSKTVMAGVAISLIAWALVIGALTVLYQK